MMRPSLLLALVVIAYSPAALGATILRVKADAAPGGNGASWPTAFDDLRDALDAAGEDYEIWVAAGVYRADRGAGDREATFYLQSSLALYGGFVGTETSRDQRDWEANETILQGDLNGNDAEDPTDYFDCCFAHTAADTCKNATCSAAVCDVNEVCCTTFWNSACADLAASLCSGICTTPTRSDNVYHVVSAVNVDSTAVLDGFTVTGGHANGLNFGPDPSSQDQGSGFNNYHSTPIVANCLFTDNWTNNHGAVNDHGGITLTNCTIRGNFSGNIGGGLYIHHLDVGPTSLTGCTIAGNVTETQGGGVYNKGNNQTTFTDCTISGNSSAGYGAGVYNSVNDVSFTNCSFVGNTSEAYGGGLAFYGATLTLDGCVFDSNTALWGGGIYHFAGSAVLSDCVFTQNRGTAPGSGGGGMYTHINTTANLTDCSFIQNTSVGDGGGLTFWHAGNSVLTRCLFEENTGRLGGGFINYVSEVQTLLTSCSFIGNSALTGAGAYFYRDQPTLVNCLFNGNTATDTGGAVVAAYNTASLINCTIFGNSADRAGGVYAQSIGEDAVVQVVTLTNSIVWGNSDSDGTVQTSQVYPGFDSVPQVSYSNVQGWDGTMEGVFTISLAPVFVDPLGDDNMPGTSDDILRLVLGSPGVGAGDNDAIPSGVDTDLDGNLRIVDGAVDMGAYEVQIAAEAIPAASMWGLITLALSVLVAGTIVVERRSAA